MALVLTLIAAGCTGAPAGEATSVEILALGDAHHGERFEPAEQRVFVGEPVSFLVVGSTPHTVDFEDGSGVSSPRSGNLDEGETHVVTFSEPGTYRYYCQYHIPGMRGTLVVEA